MTPAKELLRQLGVYRIDHKTEEPELLVALKNNSTGDYAYELARAIDLPASGEFTYDQSEITVIFVDREQQPRLFTSYYDFEELYDDRPCTDLTDTGLTATAFEFPNNPGTNSIN